MHVQFSTFSKHQLQVCRRFICSRYISSTSEISNIWPLMNRDHYLTLCYLKVSLNNPLKDVRRN